VVLGKLDIYMWQAETRPHLSPCMKINARQIKDLNTRPETLKPQEKKNSGTTSRYRHMQWLSE
jgi:hypothetical protein